MSSLWTPGGERPVGRPGEAGPANDARPTSPPPPPESAAEALGLGADIPPEQREAIEQELRAAQEQLRATPVEVVVANHAIGMFQLAVLHLSGEEPDLDAARLAIDALASVVEGLGERLGEHLEVLSDALRQARIAWVQLSEDHGSAT